VLGFDISKAPILLKENLLNKKIKRRQIKLGRRKTFQLPSDSINNAAMQVAHTFQLTSLNGEKTFSI